MRLNTRRDRILRGNAQFWSAAALTASFFVLSYLRAGFVDAALAIGLVVVIAWCSHAAIAAAVNRFFGPR